mgnify:FL=1
MMVKKNMVALFVDNGKTGDEKGWVRIAKSTTFDLSLNPVTNQREYIVDAHPTTDVDDYAPSLNQQITMYTGEEDYELLFPLAYSLPIGENAKRDVLVIFSQEKDTDNKYKAWKTTATLSFTNVNTVDSTLTMDITFGGTITKGTATPDATTHKPTFTPAAEPEGEWVDPFAVVNA